MRITTQMLHNSAAKAGVTINHSLLNYIGNASSGSSLLSMLSGSDNNSAVKSRYDKLYEESDELLGYVTIFGAEKEPDSIFDRARKSGDIAEICKSVKEAVESYNKTLKAAGSISDTLTGFYIEMLKEAVSDEKESLESAGLTVMSDGTIIVDEEKLASLDVDTLESVFGGKDSIMDKIAFVAEKIADNAKANSESLTSSYDANGNLSLYAMNKYNFLG